MSGTAAEIAVAVEAVEPWWKTRWIALPIFAAAAVAGGVAAAVARRRSPPDGPGTPDWCHPGVGILGGQLEDVDYVELRTGDAGPDEPLPMVIALHTRGMKAERIAEFASGLPGKVRVIAPVGFEDAGLGHSWTATKPDDPKYGAELQDVAAYLVNFIEAIQQCRPTLGKPVVSGYSGGADLAFALAAEAGGQLGGSVGAAGWFPPGVGPVTSPVVVVHGRNDTAVPYDRTANEVAARIGTTPGEPIQLVPMEGVGHSFAGALQIKWLEQTAKAAAAQATA